MPDSSVAQYWAFKSANNNKMLSFIVKVFKD